jgi:hypothetical protein
MSEPQAQVSCLVSAEDGWSYMEQFDRMPPATRERLRQSPYNLCAECLFYEAFARDGDYHAAIDEMERQIRCQECES